MTKKKRFLIVGAGEAGKGVLKEIVRIGDGYEVVGFIDDDPQKIGKKINGTKVIGGREVLPQAVKEKKVDEIIIAIPSANGEQIAEIVKFCSKARVGYKIVPRVREIIEGAAHFSSLRKVEVEDLLGRPVIKSDVNKILLFLKGKKVLITGAAGSIGSELARQVAAYNPKGLILVDWWENGVFDFQREMSKNFPKVNIFYYIANIQNREKLTKIFEKHTPHFVFHAAAYKHVPLMEENPDEAVRNNVFGTLNVAEISLASKVDRFVEVSTDKAANPVNVMGMTKLIAEGIVKGLNTKGMTKFMIVRFGNVLGSNGSVVPLFKRQIEMGGPVTVTDKRMTRYFMTIPEAAQLIIKAASIGKGGELFVLDMGEPVKILDLAEQMIRLSGCIPGEDIKIVFTGKRKGEKLSEVLLNDKEKLISTKDGKIMKTESFGLENNEIKEIVKKFGVLLKENDEKGIKREFKRLIKRFEND